MMNVKGLGPPLAILRLVMVELLLQIHFLNWTMSY